MEESAKIDEVPLDPEPKPQFKKPVLVGRVGKLPKKALTDVEIPPQSKNDDQTSQSQDKPGDVHSAKSSLPPAMLLKEISTPIPYKEPKWSGLCPEGTAYALEVLKSGMIMERIDLTTKPFFVFGRLANCDVVAGHPTLSRHHAVLQYKAFAEEGEQLSGWYLQDLGSTHGTFLNRDRLKPHHYTRVRVGHQIKFGSSTRSYIIVGPDFDCEGESELTVTEIKQKSVEMKKERDRMMQEVKEQRERDIIEAERKREEQGIDWGMGEDAEEEPDLSENPFAVTTNEELYLEDPKKTLRGYFEREGHELNYDCEERGIGQFICRVELPMDDARGRPIVAEVIHKGKKKEAVVACALEACRVLDRAGLLRQAKHESRRRKQRDWSADDYYDSDDDTFLDRTGAVERKREKRKDKHVDEKKEPLTYDGLLKQITEIESKIATEEKCLERLRAIDNTKDMTSSEDGDSLDKFMSSLGQQKHSMAQKAEISTTKMTIQKLKSELSKTQRLAEIARPAHLPPLLKKEDAPKMSVKIGSNSVVYGKRLRLKDDTRTRPKIKQTVKKDEQEEFVEEVDSDEETNDTEPSRSNAEDSRKITEDFRKNADDIRKVKRNAEKSKSGAEDSTNEEKSDKNVQNKVEASKTEDSIKEKRVFGPMRPPDNYEVPESYYNEASDRDLPEIMEDE